jgi:hypothetical protein
MLEAASVHVQHGVYHAYALFFGGLDEHGGRAVTEQRAGGAVFVVRHRRHHLGCHHYHLLVHASADVCGGVLQSHDESCACSLHVVAVAGSEAYAMCYYACRGGKAVVGVGRGADYEVDFVKARACAFQQPLHGFDAHVGRTGAFFFKDMALLDSYAGGNPLVVGVDHARQVVVGEYVVRHVGCDACNFRVKHCFVFVCVEGKRRAVRVNEKAALRALVCGS